MAWTGDVARVHCDVISAQTYLGNAIAALEGMKAEERPGRSLPLLRCALQDVERALPDLEVGVSPETLELLRASVLPLKGA